MNEPVHKTKKDAVVELIRESILSAELKPGDRLLQDEIAQRMNVSATPVREALRQLEAEGVLAHSPHQGARVAPNSCDNHIKILIVMRNPLRSTLRLQVLIVPLPQCQ